MPDLINKRLGEYRITEEIGRGGMGTVYKAWDSSRKRHVALKVLPAYFVHDEVFVKRFRRESQAVAALHHPHIVQLYEASDHQGTLFMSMQYVDGGTLKELLQEEAPLDPERCLPIIVQIAQALDYAHEQGFVHRDVKPTNILLTKEGLPILTDFGIAKAAAGTSLTRTGFGMGTPEYMSPEQSQGKDVDSRSDVYSLGIILYEMLTGQVPFTAETPLVVLHHHVYETPLPPRQINPDLPSRVEQVVLKALAKGPEQRYATAGALAEALGRAVLEVEEETATIAQIPGLEDAEATVAVRVEVDEKVVDPLYSQALAAFEEERWQEAIDLLTQTLAVAGDYRETFARLTEASKQRRLETLLAEAEQAMEEEEWTGAIDLCVEILSLEPSHQNADTLLREARRAQGLRNLYAQAEEELASGALSSAIEYLERVLELAPDYRDAQSLLERAREELARQQEMAELCALGTGFLEAQEWQSAIESFRSILSLQPEHEEALQLLAQAEAGLAQVEELDSLYQRGLECLKDENWPEAIEALRRFLEKDSSYRDAQELLAQAETGLQLATVYTDATAALRGGEIETAIEKLKELLAIDPHYMDASQLLARVEQEVMAGQDEKERLERIEKLHTTANECLQSENWEAAITSLQRILQIDPEHEQATLFLAEARERLAVEEQVDSLYVQATSECREENWTKAVSALTQLLELQPDHEEATDLLAQAQQELGRVDAERARLERLEKLYEQAQESVRQEQWSEALEPLEQVISSEPDYREAASLLAQAQEALETERRVESLYAEGIQALHAEDWEAASSRFQQILAIRPHSQDAAEKLHEAQRGDELAKMYAGAQTLLGKQEWTEAAEHLEELLAEEPAYKDAQQLLESAKAALAALPEAAVPTDKVAIEPTVEVPAEVLPHKRPLTYGIVGAVLAVVMLVAGGFFLLSRGISGEATTAESSVPPGAPSSVVGTVEIAQATTATASAEYEAEEVMALAEEAMAGVNSFHFDLETSHTTVYLEDGEPATLSRAKGDIVRPDSFDMQATVSLKGLPMTIRIIAVDQERVMNHPLTEGWVDVPFSLNLSVLFGEENIIDHLWEVEGMALIAVEEIEGEALYHLTTSAEGMSPYLHTLGIVREGEVEIWTDNASFHLRRVQVTGVGAEGEKIEWVMDFSAFDELVAIQLPTPQPSDTPAPVPTSTPRPPTPVPSPEVDLYPGMIFIPAGVFTMGSERYVNERPAHEVYLDPFYIDKHEVTNADYRQCVEVGVCEPPAETSTYARDSYYGSSQYDDYPVVWVSWYDARTYCQWVDKRLPTEAEWEKAARGTDGRIYPWGDGFDSSNCNCSESGIGDTTWVGQYSPHGDSPYGVADMAGNVYEWVADWYDEGYHGRRADRNPQGPSSGQYKVARGGSWRDNRNDVRCPDRGWSAPDFSFYHKGLRCARSSQ